MPKAKSPANLPIGSAPWRAASCRAQQCPLHDGMTGGERQRIIEQCAKASGADIGATTHAKLADECHRLIPGHQGQGTP